MNRQYSKGWEDALVRLGRSLPNHSWIGLAPAWLDNPDYDEKVAYSRKRFRVSSKEYKSFSDEQHDKIHWTGGLGWNSQRESPKDIIKAVGKNDGTKIFILPATCRMFCLDNDSKNPNMAGFISAWPEASGRMLILKSKTPGNEHAWGPLAAEDVKSDRIWKTKDRSPKKSLLHRMRGRETFKDDVSKTKGDLLLGQQTILHWENQPDYIHLLAEYVEAWKVAGYPPMMVGPFEYLDRTYIGTRARARRQRQIEKHKTRRNPRPRTAGTHKNLKNSKGFGSIVVAGNAMRKENWVNDLGWSQGNRNDSCNKGLYTAFQKDDSELMELVLAAARNSGLPEHEIATCMESAKTAGFGEKRNGR